MELEAIRELHNGVIARQITLDEAKDLVKGLRYGPGPERDAMKELRAYLSHLTEQARLKARIYEVRGKDKVIWRMS